MLVQVFLHHYNYQPLLVLSVACLFIFILLTVFGLYYLSSMKVRRLTDMRMPHPIPPPKLPTKTVMIKAQRHDTALGKVITIEYNTEPSTHEQYILSNRTANTVPCIWYKYPGMEPISKKMEEELNTLSRYMDHWGSIWPTSHEKSKDYVRHE